MQLSNFLTYVKYDLKRTDKDTEITQAYNDMILWIASQMPHGGYKYQSYVSTVEGQEDYALPSDMVHLIHPIRLLEGSATTDSGFPLDLITKEEYDIIEPNPNRTSPDTGKPFAYTIYSRQILVTSIPDKSTYLLEINWSKRATDQSGSSDTPYLGDEWREVLKCGVLERVNEGLGLYQEAQYWAAKYKDAEGNPIGLCKKLFDIEEDREERAINQLENNSL